MAASSDFRPPDLSQQIHSLYSDAQKFTQISATSSPITRWISGVDKTKQGLESRITIIISDIHKMDSAELLGVIKSSKEGVSDFDKLTFAIQVINPQLLEYVEPVKQLNDLVEELRYSKGDSTETIKRKIDKAEKLELGKSPQLQNAIRDLKIHYIEQYAVGNVKGFVEVMERSPELLNWIWEEIKEMPDSKIQKIEQKVQFSAKNSGMIELLHRLGETHLSEEEVLRKADQFVYLHEDLIPEDAEPLPKGGGKEAINTEILADMKRSLMSVNFEKIAVSGNDLEENEASLERIVKGAKDPNFYKMTHVFHQGINAEALVKIYAHYAEQGNRVDNIGQDNNFRVYMTIFKNVNNETVYRFVNVIGACAKEENKEAEKKPFDEFFLHIVDCKADSTGDKALISRYVSPVFESREELNRFFMDMLR